jgi:L-aspartate oxidase
MLDVLVLGSGVAGLSAAIEAARLGATVTVVTKGELVATATRYAQGGVAAALTNIDSPELHLSDTLAAGAGICDVEAVRTLVSEGPARVLELIGMGAHFDAAHAGEPSMSGPDGRRLGLAREGGHSLNRVLHAGGDATGAEIERALAAAVAASSVELREGVQAIDLEIEQGRCVGVRALDDDGHAVTVRARHVVLASGGAGQLFAVTTNPGLSTGGGVAMALRAGVGVADVEFMQFHPTALAEPTSPRPLLSEALRGEGAVLRDEHGVAFMVDEHPLADLAPRDVVSRCIARRLLDRGLDHLWLDATSIEEFPDRFPTIWRSCRAVGLDPRRDWLPVAPAAHYLCGGILTDLDGATTLPGLWACGEVAASGVHGANRLASNSLLDGLVFGVRAGQAITKGIEGPSGTGALRGVDLGVTASPAPRRPSPGAPAADGHGNGTGAVGSERHGGVLAGVPELQRTMTNGCGVLRDAEGLAAAAAVRRRLADAHPLAAATTRPAADRRDLLDVAGALIAAATAREESRGAHTRTDFPERSDRFLGRFVHQGAEPVWVPMPEGDRAPAR